MQNIDTYSRRFATALINEGSEVLGIDVHFLANALGWAVTLKEQHVKTLTDLATALRAGAKYPMWAEGENGARAAEHLATSHQHDVERLCAIIDVLWDRTSTAMLVTESAEVAE